MPPPDRAAPNPLLKLAIEAGPLAVFFLVNRMGAGFLIGAGLLTAAARRGG